MNTKIHIDFENFTFQAKREFDAPVSLVWRAYTEKALLDQWWAPKPWKTETKNIDFRPNGKWVYDMVGPDGERHGAIQIFKEIVLKNTFQELMPLLMNREILMNLCLWQLGKIHSCKPRTEH
ncbi:MAG: hypothetical protein HC892_19110 [Saprospiraceae bacterium]|nr:hypothetical protein [Saprospiraceae bacterium]